MRLLAASPHIRKQKRGLIITTSWWWRILLLGLSLRKVKVDLKDERIRVISRYLWLIVYKKSIKFSSIQAVTYGYEDMATRSVLSSTHDSFDCFSVGIRLYNNDEMGLFRFYGEGTITYEGMWSDWWSSRSRWADFSGTQESDSRAFAELLSNILNVSIVPPRH